LLWFSASNRILASLGFESLADVVIAIFTLKRIHTALQSIVLPTEEVVAVLTMAGAIKTPSVSRSSDKRPFVPSNLRITKAVHQRLFTILVVLGIKELPGIPHYLIHHLRCADWVSSWAGGASHDGTRSIRHVTLMIGAVQVLSIPALRKDDGRTDTARAWFGREAGRVLAVTWGEALAVTHAPVTNTCVGTLGGTESWVARKHSETLFSMSGQVNQKKNRVICYIRGVVGWKP